MKISVIIPVYNAEHYIAEAVKSALAQKQTEEVILVEDGSPDGSLKACIKLEKIYKKVQLFTHPNNLNLGPSTSRNLGVKRATCEYLAFLDADDFYLDNRFEITERVFNNNPGAEGVYEAIGTHFESNLDRKRYLKKKRPILTTIHADVPPEEVFENQQPIGNKGYCSLVGLTVKRKVFEKTGLFDAKLYLHEDTAFRNKLAACAKLVPGKIDAPIAMRRIHTDNRFIAERTDKENWQGLMDMWLILYRWICKNHISKNRRQLVVERMFWQSNTFTENKNSYMKNIIVLWRYLRIFFHEPRMIIEKIALKRFLKQLWIVITFKAGNNF
jgi:glycosyltransferase involved in cell wall biosynthesis